MGSFIKVFVLIGLTCSALVSSREIWENPGMVLEHAHEILKRQVDYNGTTPENRTYVATPENSTYIVPSENSTYVAPPDNSTYVTPPENSTYFVPPENSTYVAPPDNSTYVAPPENPTYVAPSENSTYVAPSENSTYYNVSAYTVPVPVLTIPNGDMTATNLNQETNEDQMLEAVLEQAELLAILEETFNNGQQQFVDTLSTGIKDFGSRPQMGKLMSLFTFG